MRTNNRTKLNKNTLVTVFVLSRRDNGTEVRVATALSDHEVEGLLYNEDSENEFDSMIRPLDGQVYLVPEYALDTFLAIRADRFDSDIEADSHEAVLWKKRFSHASHSFAALVDAGFAQECCLGDYL